MGANIKPEHINRVEGGTKAHRKIELLIDHHRAYKVWIGLENNRVTDGTTGLDFDGFYIRTWRALVVFKIDPGANTDRIAWSGSDIGCGLNR